MSCNSEEGRVEYSETAIQEHSRIRDNIAISGISGRFPESQNVEEFWTNLVSGIDMVTENEDRWPKGVFGLPPTIGVVKENGKFDSSFFGILPKQTDGFAPEIRILLETTFECIVDAGIDPSELRGKKIGVYVGMSRCDTEEFMNSISNNVLESRYSVLGSAGSMLANRLSFYFDFKGPSFVVDTAGSSGTQALTSAIQDMLANKCEASVVAAANICLRPAVSVIYMKQGLLSPDGKCKAFDETANGFARSESVVSLFIQRGEDARRVYATVVNAKTCCSGKDKEETTYASEATQRKLFEDTYREVGMSPSDICYIEANGTGILKEDIKEVNAISSVFCRDRHEPLLMGSVKSNMGFSEAASGLVSIVKLVLAMHYQIIPPNLHYNTPHPCMKLLINGSICVPRKPTPWNGHFAAVNCYGEGGVNSHVILRANKIQNFSEFCPPIPRLMACCGRTQEGVEQFLNEFETLNITQEDFSLLNEINRIPTSFFEYRGFLLQRKDDIRIAKEINRAPYERAPIWYIFTGMGSQWSKMGKDLMELELFRSTIERLSDALKPFGIHLVQLLNDSSEQEMRTTTMTFVSITAVQVALLNSLKTLGISPDGIIGHSIGEVACAYADGCITEEQAMAIAYWQGKCIDDAKLPQGGMATIGLSIKETETRLPKGVVVACHNSKNSVTISGLEDEIVKFVDDIKTEGVFATYVNTCGIPFHSPFMIDAEGSLKHALKQVITNPKRRSSLWLSTSIPRTDWNSPLAQFASSDYFVNNLLSPVLFEEAIRNIPPRAIVVEIAPHGLLQSVLKKGLPSSCNTIGLTMNKRHPNNLEHFLVVLGKLFNMGVDIAFNRMYPSVPYPVSSKAMILSSIIKWNHSQTWYVANWKDCYNEPRKGNIFTVDLANPEKETEFLTGHCIDGRVLYPATGYLCLAWKAFSEILGYAFPTLSIAFEDCAFPRATILPKSGKVKFIVDVHPIGGRFEITEGDSVACSGRIYIPDKYKLKKMTTLGDLPNKRNTETIILDQKDIYKVFRLKGYEYTGDFQSLVEADMKGLHGTLKWNGNFVTFLDGMMQLAILDEEYQALNVPVHLRSLVIDVTQLYDEFLGQLGENKPVAREKSTNICVSAGIEMKGLKLSPVSRKETRQPPVLESYSFTAYFENNILSRPEKEELREYTSVCSNLCNKILDMVQDDATRQTARESIDSITDDDKESILLTKYKKEVLLGTLNQIYSLKPKSLSEKEVQHLIYDYNRNRKCDPLFQVMLSEKTLRVALDLVIENIFSRHLKIVEIVHEQSIVVANEVLTIFKNYAIINMPTYTIAAKDVSLIDQTALNFNALTMTGFNRLEDLENLKTSDLIICQNPFDGFDIEEFFSNSSDAMKENGFLLLVMRTSLIAAERLIRVANNITRLIPLQEEIQRHAEEKGLLTISLRGDSEIGSCVMLFRKCPKVSPSVQTVICLNERCYNWVEELKKEWRLKSEGNIWLVGSDNETNGIIGFVNCLRKEPGGERIRCIFGCNGKSDSLVPPVNLESKEYEDVIKKDLVMNVFIDGIIGSFRHQSLPPDPEPKPQENAYLNILVKGDLSKLRWFSSPTRLWPKDTRLCDVYYASLNFKDIMLASGKLPLHALPESQLANECFLGFEYVGRDRVTGKRIMGLINSEAFATTVQVNERLVWDVPDEWTLEDACTVPLTYVTAYYAMILRGKMKRGSKILIHSGSGGVGQAAINIALSMDCEVFVTVGTRNKIEFLKKRFPQLKQGNLFWSRDTEFEARIMKATNGRGVDMVLNSLAEEKLQASVRCLAEYGVFLELGKYDMSQDNKLGLEAFVKNIQFHGILLDMFLDDTSGPRMETSKLSALLLEGIKTGVVKPLPRKTFHISKAEEAFRYMARGEHIGKIALKIREEEEATVALANPVVISAITNSICDPSKTYVITGGLGGFGLELTKWLISRGAKTLILTSRSGIKTAYQRMCFEQWKKKGIRVVASKLNICKSKEAIDLLSNAKEYGPVGGIFHLAMVLENAIFENQTEVTFKAVCDPKVNGTHNLDVASRNICPDVEWFVVFSSVISGRGNAGQSNYGFANSVMERICERRRKDGLSALAIQWGPIDDVGAVYDSMGGNDAKIGGIVPQRIHSCLETLDRFLQEDYTVLSSLVKDNNSEKADSRKCNPMEAVANILGIKDINNISEEILLSGLGLDSLMAVEVRQCFEREYDIVLSMQDIRNLTFSKLKEMNEAYISEKQQTSQVPSKETELSGTFVSSSSSYFTIPTELSVSMNSVTDGVPLFIIHPIEGNVDSLKTLASLLPFPVIGIQHTREAARCESIEKLALFYLKVIQNLYPRGPYNIAGYSFGTIPAFEIALQLQEKANGKKMPQINLIMIEGSPLVMSYESQAQQQHFEIEKRYVEAKILAGLLRFQGLALNFSQFIDELASLPNSKARLNQLADTILERLSPAATRDEVIETAEAFLRRSQLSQTYLPKGKFNGDATLIKASRNILSLSEMPHDFGLSQVISGKVAIHVIEGDHASIISGNTVKETAEVMTKLVKY